MTTTSKPAVDKIWSWLQEVPDPEIPVISIVDLGIIRGVSWEGDTLVIQVTPTYSGCPATAVINHDIEQHLRKQGIENVQLVRQLSPAWTTAWMTDRGRHKLEEYGIAPPAKSNGVTGVATVVKCPRCQSETTEKISQFGSTPCKASYRCKECLEPFDYFKCI